MSPYGRGSGFSFLGCAVAVYAAGPAALPNDPDFAKQWALQNTGQVVNNKPGTPGADIRALAAWDIFPGSSSVIVAIIGTGVDPHPEFADRLLEGYVASSASGDPYSTLDTDASSRGTRVAGIVGAATGNGLGIAGVNGNAWLLPVRVLPGIVGADASTAEGVEWAVDHGAKVVLIPLQFYVSMPKLAAAVAYAAAHDAVVVAPAGHDPGNGVAFPAAFEGCIAVSSTTSEDETAIFSNYGPEVDLSAPSEHIWSTHNGGGYGFEASPGSPYASAYVAGVASLIRSYAPQLTADEVKDILINSADDLGAVGWDPYFGAGRLNAQRALELTTLPPLRFESIDPFPTTIPPNQQTSFTIRIADGGQQVLPESAILVYRTAAAGFSAPIPLRFLGNGMFAIDLPSAPCETTIEYYLSAAGDGGAVVTEPLDAPANLHTVRAILYQPLFDDDFENDLSWEVVTEGGETTRGAWGRELPMPTSAQPGYDYSTDHGQYCFLTDPRIATNDEGRYDVDGGPVRLISPVIPITTPDAEVSYARWFYTTSGTADALVVELSRDGGLSWTIVETVPATNGWATHSFLLSDFPKVIGNELRVRFTTADIAYDSLTEAAVDEFHVRGIDCTAIPGDADGDGDVDLVDYRRLHQCWKGPVAVPDDPNCSLFDFNRDGHIDLNDLQEFQNYFRP